MAGRLLAIRYPSFDCFTHIGTIEKSNEPILFPHFARWKTEDVELFAWKLSKVALERECSPFYEVDKKVGFFF